MGRDFEYQRLLKVLYDAVLLVSANRYLCNRPKSVSDKIDDFVVVDVPYSIQSVVYGSGFGTCYTICKITLYVRERDGQLNVLKMDGMVGALEDIFPVTLDGFIVSRPRVVLKGSDGYGFHAVVIQCDVRGG